VDILSFFGADDDGWRNLAVGLSKIMVVCARGLGGDFLAGLYQPTNMDYLALSLEIL
jgi:hypothetical protein